MLIEDVFLYIPCSWHDNLVSHFVKYYHHKTKLNIIKSNCHRIYNNQEQHPNLLRVVCILVEDVHFLFCGWNTSMLFRYSIPSEPPTIYSRPSTTAVPTSLRRCFIGAIIVHVFLSGLYISTVSKLCPLQPPIANRWLLRTATPTRQRGVFMGETWFQIFVWLL